MAVPALSSVCEAEVQDLVRRVHAAVAQHLPGDLPRRHLHHPAIDKVGVTRAALRHDVMGSSSRRASHSGTSSPPCSSTSRNRCAGMRLRRPSYPQSALIGLLDEQQLLSAENVFVEFGAGKACVLSEWMHACDAGQGKLLHMLHTALGPDIPTTFVAIERSSFRYAHNNFGPGVDIQRVKIDIEVRRSARHISIYVCASLTGAVFAERST